MRIETREHGMWVHILSLIVEQSTAFKFWAGSYWKEGTLIYYIQASREE